LAQPRSLLFVGRSTDHFLQRSPRRRRGGAAEASSIDSRRRVWRASASSRSMPAAVRAEVYEDEEAPLIIGQREPASYPAQQESPPLLNSYKVPFHRNRASPCVVSTLSPRTSSGHAGGAAADACIPQERDCAIRRLARALIVQRASLASRLPRAHSGRGSRRERVHHAAHAVDVPSTPGRSRGSASSRTTMSPGIQSEAAR
jgi:hypothetical protein